MAWRLYEAHRDKGRKLLGQAGRMSLMQDASARGSLLLTRYVASGPGLVRASGILLVADARKVSRALRLADPVLKGLRSFATHKRETI